MGSVRLTCRGEQVRARLVELRVTPEGRYGQQTISPEAGRTPRRTGVQALVGEDAFITQGEHGGV
jgi:hypothetical protein